MRGFPAVRATCLFLVILPVIVACAEVPTAELAAYRDSYAAAQTAGQEALAEFAATKKRHDAVIARIPGTVSKPADPFATAYDAGADAGNGFEKQLAARYQAFETIGRYNDLLVALAENRNVAEIKGKVAGFTDSLETFLGFLGTTVPGLSMAAPIVDTLFEKAQEAQNAETFKVLVENGEVVIADIVTKVLLPDINNYDTARRDVDKREIFTVERDNATLNALAIHRLVANHYAPKGELLKQRDTANSRLIEALNALGIDDRFKRKIDQGKPPARVEIVFAGPFLSLPPPAGGAAPDPTLEYTVVVQNQVDLRVEAVEASAQKVAMAVEDLQTYQDVLRNYEAMLAATLESLKTLRANLGKPKKASTVFNEVLPIALSIRRDLRALRKP